MKIKLTERQQEVLDLVLARYTQRSIAKFLKITPPSVNIVVKRLVELDYLEEHDNGVYLKKKRKVINRVVRKRTTST